MRVWRWFAAAAVWLLAVVIVATVAWFAIDSAGHEVGASDDVVGLVAAAQPAAPPGSPAAPPGSPPGSPAVPASPAASPPTSSTELGAVRPDSGTGTPARSGAGAQPPTPSVPGSGSGRTGTFGSTGGDLVVRCVGDGVDGWAIRPADGWRGEAAPASGGRLDVLFAAGDGRAVAVQVTCRDGQPSFSPREQSARR